MHQLTFVHQKRLFRMKKDSRKIIKGFKAVDFMRKVRSKISADIEGMTYKQVKAYFENRKIALSAKK